jgi:hypothetical protein
MNAYWSMHAKGFGWQNTSPDEGPVGEHHKPGTFDFGT